MTFIKGARQKWLPCFLFSLLLSLTIFLGHSMNADRSIAPLYASYLALLLTVLKVLGTALLLSALLSLALHALFQISFPFPTLPAFIQRLDDRRLFFPLLWVSLFLLYVPYLLAYYPGVFSYDLPAQTQMVRGLIPFTSANPPLHTWIWSLCLLLEKATGFYAVTSYALFQMFCLSGVEAAVLRDMAKRPIPFFTVILSWLFFALNPVIGIFSIIPVKDVIFGLFFLRSFPDITDLVQDPEDFFFNEAGDYALSRILRLALCILGACLFRHNAFYAYIVWFFILLLCSLKMWKQILLQFIPVFVLYYLITNLLFPAMGISSGRVREMYSVPIQQLSHAIVNHHDEFSEEELAALDEYLPVDNLEKLFNPRLADPVKARTNLATSDQVGPFLSLWAKYLKQYPQDYVDAFLDLNLPYWYLGAKSVDPYSKRQYIETGLKNEKVYPVERRSLLPGLLWRFQKIAKYSDLADNPVFFIWLSISLPIWAVLFTALVLILKRRTRDLLILAPAFLYYLTFLLGPVSNCRYIFPFMLLYPCLLGLMLTEGR